MMVPFLRMKTIQQCMLWALCNCLLMIAKQRLQHISRMRLLGAIQPDHFFRARHISFTFSESTLESNTLMIKK
jgi:hypothetical protein